MKVRRFIALIVGILIDVIIPAVQWFRQRFNECFDKAEFAKSRSQDDLPQSATIAEKLIYDRALEIVQSLLFYLVSIDRLTCELNMCVVKSCSSQ